MFTMQSIERRIAALESQASTADAPKFVIVRVGETKAEALKREGHPPDAVNVRYVVFVSPTDASL